MNVFCSSGAFKGLSYAGEVLAKAQSMGISKVELSSGLKATHECFKKIEIACERMELRIHNYFPAPDEPFVLNLAAAEEATRRHSIEFCKQAIELSTRIGAPYYSVHAGFVADLQVAQLGNPESQQQVISQEMFEKATKRFEDSVIELLEHVERYDIRLLLENNVDAVPRSQNNVHPSHLLLTHPDEIVTFFDKMKHERLGLLLDVAHLRVSATHQAFDPVKGINKFQSYIEALHLSDNDGISDTNQMLSEKSWFWEPISCCLDIDQVEAVLEVYQLNDNDIVGQLDMCGQYSQNSC